MSAERARRGSAIARRRAVALALGLIALAAIVPALAAVGPPPAGVHAQPVLGVADERMRLMGAGSDGVAWGYRELPLSTPPPVVDGRRLEFAPGDHQQLAFLRWTRATGWQYAEIPLDESGQPLRSMGPNRRTARVTPRGGALLLGTDRRPPPEGSTEARPPLVLRRDPGERFRALPTPPAAVLGAGEALVAEQGAGRAAVAAYDAGDRTGAFVAAIGPAVESAIVHWDGEGWSREPVEVPVESQARFEIAAISATAAGNAWMAARKDVASGRGISLFERVTEGGTPRWIEHGIGETPFTNRSDTDRGLDEVQVLGDSAQSLTATTDGVWVDGAMRAAAGGGETHTFTLFFDTRSRPGNVTGSWCDAIDSFSDRVCAQPLGVRLSGLAGYRSFAWPGDGFGSRIVTNPLDPDGDSETNRGTYLRLDGTRFERMPGAGGHFRAGGAFASPDEGWLEGPVHITRDPEPEGLRDSWPVSGRAPLAAIATEPARTPGDLGVGALAAGPDGNVLRYQPGQGWTREFLLSSSGTVVRSALRGVAWPEASRAHAVGDLGTMWMWRRETGLWERDPGAPIGYEANLMDVAFQPGNPDRGYAVGKGGALLSYEKGWIQQPLPGGFQSANLTQIAFAGSQAIVAAGTDLLVNDGGGWRVDEDAHRLLGSMPGQTQLFAVAGLPDGGAVAAGKEVLIERDSAGSPWRFADQPLPGSTAVAAAAFRDGGRVRAVVSVARLGTTGQRVYPPVDDVGQVDPNAPVPLLPAFPLPPDGFVLRETATGWRDEQHSAYSGSDDDRPIKSDPVLDLALNSNGTGWAVGGWSGEQDAAGSGSSAKGSNGRADRTRVQTAAVFRYGDGGVPPPGAAQAGVPLPSGPVRLAVAGHAACQTACADLALQDIRPDRSLAAALEKVAGLRTQPNGPRMMLYTGGRLAAGLDATAAGRETVRYASLMASAPVPVYPAVSGTDAAAAFRSSFANFFAPFGGGPPAPGVDSTHIPGAPAAPGARTHYAFDSVGPEGALRVIVIDNSAGSLEESDPHQNPIEPQRPWLAATLADASARGIPAIVLGSRDLNSRNSPRLNTANDADVTARMLVEGGASAYFFERPEENRAYQISGGAAGSIPAFGTGTLGYRSSISNPGSRNSASSLFGDSGYLLAEVDLTKRNPFTNRAPATVRLIPLIEDLAIQAIDGSLLRRSRPALFQGLGRRPLAGDRWRPLSGGNADPSGSDPYVSFPPEQCLLAGCANRVTPEYEFLSSDPDLGDFVKQDPSSTNLRKPLLGADGKPISDSRSGLFCAFNAGVTTVTVRAGGLSYSQQVRIQPGSVQRPCGTRPLRPDRFRRAGATASPPPPPAAPQGGNDPPVSFDPPPPPATAQAPSPPSVAAKPPVPIAPFIPLGEPLGFLPPTPLPVPGAVLRPSPPSGGFGRAFEKQREEEVAPEEMQAATRFHHEDQGFPAGYLLGALVLAALAGSTIFGGPRPRTRVQPAPAYARQARHTRRRL